MLAITTYFHLPRPRDALSARTDHIPYHAAHIADPDLHSRSRNCAVRPAIEAGRVPENDLHLDDHSRRFENRPHS